MNTAQKLEALSGQFDRLVGEMPTKPELAAVQREVHQIHREMKHQRKILDQIVLTGSAREEAAVRRHEAMMTILGDVLARLA